MSLPDHKTKIIAAIGPASESPEMLERLILAGMNVARLNFSHGDFSGHAERISRIRALERKTGRVAIMADLPGPKMRIGSIDPEPIELYPGGGAKMGRSAGTAVQLVAKEGDFATLRLPSTEMRRVPIDCRATVGEVGNSEAELINGSSNGGGGGGVTFIASTGDVSWNGNPYIDFKAPRWGPYKGLLIYLPYGNSSPLTINGNSQQTLTGSIIAVSSPIKINGNSGTFALSSEIICYTVSLAGNGNIVIDYDPDDMFEQIDPTLIQMTK